MILCVCVCEFIGIAHNRAIRPCYPSHFMPLALTPPCVCVFIKLRTTAPCGPLSLVITAQGGHMILITKPLIGYDKGDTLSLEVLLKS